MKKQLLTLLGCVAFVAASFAQAPEGFKYQAVVRNTSNNIITNQAVGIRMTIQQGSIGGTTVYSESFSETTNAYGLVNLEIGTGTVISGSFSAVNWANGPFFMETAIDLAGGNNYVVMGTSQLLSVPYALYAKTAEFVENDEVNDADADPANEIQVLSFSNDTVYLSNGGSIYLGDYAIDNVDDADANPTNELQIISFTNDTLYLSNGGSVYLGDYAIDNVDDADANPTNELQNLSLVGNDLSISSGNSVNLAGVNTDNQTLSYTAGTSTLAISGGNSVVIPNGDITDVTAGDGLTGGGTSGNVTVTAAANNGLNVDAAADAIQLGGTLTENTLLTHGNFNLTHDLNGTGDFIIQDAGVNHFEVRDNGTSYFGGSTNWSAVNTSGTTIAALNEDTDDGRFLIYENGVPSVDLDANTQFVFNEQALDRDFRIESTLSPNAFFLDAGLDRIGMGTNLPQAKLQVTGGAIMPAIGLGATNGIMFPANAYGGGGDVAYIQYYAQSGEQTSLRIGNENDWDDNIGFYQYGAQRMTIHDGNVGIGTVTPVYQLELGSNSAGKPTSNTWTVTSDRRLKTNIHPYEGGLSDLMKIKPVWFTYTGEANMPKETGVGVIAQELQEVAPYMIKPWTYKDEKGNKTEYLGVDNGAMTYMLINSVQEQQVLIDQQKTENEELKKLILQLQERVEKLEGQE
ncbi:MAG TPA: tail fiber domain-containing protein [Fluviicola sp.]|nr:tail fiber domain-containing protein [Fluviicola sp.]